MDERTALGWLVVSVLNEHFPHPEEDWDEEDPLGAACDNRVCGPCGALVWFSHPFRRAVLESYVRQTGFQEGGWAHWDDERDGLRWDWFAEYWKRHRGCWMSNGVVGCFGDDKASVIIDGEVESGE